MPHPMLVILKRCHPERSEGSALSLSLNIVIPSEARNLLLAATAHPATYASSHPNQTEGCPTLSAFCALGWEPMLPKRPAARRNNSAIPADSETTLSSRPERSAVEGPCVLHDRPEINVPLTR